MRSLRFSRVGLAVAVVVAGLGSLTPGCTVGQEGERCNPELSHDECNSGLTCQQPPNCPETYCCPPLSASGESTSKNPYCQPGCNGGQASICAAAMFYDSGVEAACGESDAASDSAKEAGSRDGHSD